jgi:hypothetical protein
LLYAKERRQGAARERREHRVYVADRDSIRFVDVAACYGANWDESEFNERRVPWFVLV